MITWLLLTKIYRSDMKFSEKKAIRERCESGQPFWCAGHTLMPIPYDPTQNEDVCYQCEMDCLCHGDILEMCEFVNSFWGHDEYCFKIYTPNIPEFDSKGRYIESPCYGCMLDDCKHCPKD